DNALGDVNNQFDLVSKDKEAGEELEKEPVADSLLLPIELRPYIAEGFVANDSLDSANVMLAKSTLETIKSEQLVADTPLEDTPEEDVTLDAENENTIFNGKFVFNQQAAGTQTNPTF